jgi:hypothetical protein
MKDGGSGRVETVVGVEGRAAGGGVNGVVVSGFGNGEVRGPIIMKRMDVSTKDLLNGTVSTFGLTISLRVIRCRHVEFSTEVSEEGLPEVGGEPWVSVGDNDGGEEMQAVHVVDKQEGQLLSGDALVATNEVRLLGEEVNKGGDGVVGDTVEAFGWRETRDEVKGDVGPRPRGNGKGLEEAGRRLSGGFGTLASGARLNVRFDCT